MNKTNMVHLCEPYNDKISSNYYKIVELGINAEREKNYRLVKL